MRKTEANEIMGRGKIREYIYEKGEWKGGKWYRGP